MMLVSINGLSLISLCLCRRKDDLLHGLRRRSSGLLKQSMAEALLACLMKIPSSVGFGEVWIYAEDV